MFEIELKYVERGMPIILTVRSGAGQAAELVRFLPTEPGTHTFTSDEVAAALSPGDKARAPELTEEELAVLKEDDDYEDEFGGTPEPETEDDDGAA